MANQEQGVACNSASYGTDTATGGSGRRASLPYSGRMRLRSATCSKRRHPRGEGAVENLGYLIRDLTMFLVERCSIIRFERRDPRSSVAVVGGGLLKSFPSGATRAPLPMLSLGRYAPAAC